MAMAGHGRGILANYLQDGSSSLALKRPDEQPSIQLDTQEANVKVLVYHVAYLKIKKSCNFINQPG